MYFHEVHLFQNFLDLQLYYMFRGYGKRTPARFMLSGTTYAARIQAITRDEGILDIVDKSGTISVIISIAFSMGDPSNL